MYVRWVVALCLVILLVGGVFAFEAAGTIQKVDTENGQVVIRVNGQERTVKAAKDIQVVDREGKKLADGLKSKELKEGVEATFTIEPARNEPIIKAIRLGKKETITNQAIPNRSPMRAPFGALAHSRANQRRYRSQLRSEKRQGRGPGATVGAIPLGRWHHASQKRRLDLAALGLHQGWRPPNAPRP